MELLLSLVCFFFCLILAILVVVLVSAVNDLRQQNQFRSLNDFSKGLSRTKVIRGGKTVEIGTGDILVGDVVVVETGDIIPAVFSY
jgi:P-type E1-E2 ATPase